MEPPQSHAAGLVRPLRGRVTVPGDKSICHRALMLAAMARGHSVVRNYLVADDTMATVRCCRQLGVTVEVLEGDLHVDSPGYEGWQQPEAPLDVGNSGTTIRLMLGMLAGRPFTTTLTGDESLRRRPMDRVLAPLAHMGARFPSVAPGDRAPITMRGAALAGVRWDSDVASAQVKSAVLLAGVQARGETVLREPALSRNHTELLLPLFDVHLHAEQELMLVALTGPQRLAPATLWAPGDFSSAAFLLVAALLVPGSQLVLPGVGLNPTRVGLLRVLKRMGGTPDIRNLRQESGELVGDLHTRAGELQAAEVPAAQVPQLIDEIPILAVAATQAHGETVIRGVGELRHKESDRMAALVEELAKMGADVTARGEDLVVRGPTPLHAAALDARGDHRLAMALAVADLAAGGGSEIRGRECATVSFPAFYDVLDGLQQPDEEPTR